MNAPTDFYTARNGLTATPAQIAARGYRVYTDELDRYRQRIVRSEVTLAPCQCREIDPSTFGTSGAAQAVAR